MSNSKKVQTATVNVLTVNTTFKSGADIGYAAAKWGDGQGSIVAAMAERYGADWFTDKGMSDDDVAEVKSGMVTRKAEITPVRYYNETERDTFVEIQPAEYDAKNERHLALSVTFAMGFTQQQFGALTNKVNNRPNYKALIKSVRDDVSTYVSGRWGGLVRAAKSAAARQQTRKSPGLFKDVLPETMAVLRKKNKVARDQRKDETALPDGVFDLMVRAAYKVVQDHYKTLKTEA